MRNIFACLVHERPDCVMDLVRNLHHLDPDSLILLYNGGKHPGLFDGLCFERFNTVVHPAPRPMKWGWLHDFALDCFRFALESHPFEAMTIVDSDQLGLRPGYSEHLRGFLAANPGAGLLGNVQAPHGPGPRAAPAVEARREVDLWRPFLRKFVNGESQFVHWTFWPSTVFTVDAARDLVALWERDEQLRDILRRSRIWASEEVLFPTLAALLGHRVLTSPCDYEWVKYRVEYSTAQLDAAMDAPRAYWAHPIPRRLEDPLRAHVRARFGGYERPPEKEAPEPVVEEPQRAPVITSRPTVSCIMPTFNRRRLVPLAVRWFLSQDWADKELVVVDDGTEPVADLLPESPNIRYVRVEGRHSVGAKRNLACEAARAEVIVHWDDDDWLAPRRLRYQVTSLLDSGADVNGLTRVYYHQPSTGRSWQYVYPRGHRPWVAGGTMCYVKAFWQRNPFADIQVGEDARFLWGAVTPRVQVLQDPSFYVARIHEANVAPKQVHQPYWLPHPTDTVRMLMGEAFDLFRAGAIEEA
jgi:hypothetical protein